MCDFVPENKENVIKKIYDISKDIKLNTQNWYHDAQSQFEIEIMFFFKHLVWPPCDFLTHFAVSPTDTYTESVPLGSQIPLPVRLYQS